MGATEFDKPLDNDFATINTNLGSPTSASGVTGADAFSKINTLNSNINNLANKTAIGSLINATGHTLSGNYTTIGDIVVFDFTITLGATVSQWTTFANITANKPSSNAYLYGAVGGAVIPIFVTSGGAMQFTSSQASGTTIVIGGTYLKA